MKFVHIITLWSVFFLSVLIGCSDDSPSGGGTGFRVVEVLPAANQQLTALEPTVSATFNYPIDTLSLTDSTITLSGSVAGSVTCDDRTISFVPTAPLDTNTTYQVTISGGLSSIGGGSLGQNYTWSFRTVDGLGWVWLESTDTATSYMMDVVWGGDKFVMVGCKNCVVTEEAAIYTSTDAVEWTERQPEETSAVTGLTGVTYFKNQFIAVGVRGTIYRSNNGETWSKVDAGISRDLRDIDGSDNLAVAVARGRVYTSTDGAAWSEVVVPFEGLLTGVCWTGSRFVVTTEGDSLAHFLVSSDGANWQDISLRGYSLDFKDFSSAAASNNLIVAVGPSQNLFTSPDAVTWTPRQLPIASGEWVFLSDVIRIHDRFVAVGGSHAAIGGYSAVSPDGIVWTQDAYVLDNGGEFTGIAWSGQKLVVSTRNMSGRIFYSQ